MDDLRNVMRVIDDNSDKLPEGDYLQLCNLLRNVYRREERKEMNNLFDYENFDMYVPGQSDQVLDYFYDHYYQTSLDNERMFLKSQKNYLENELEIYKPIKRVSKHVRLDAIQHYCFLNNILITQHTPEKLREFQIANNLFVDEKKFQKHLQKIYKGFIHMENTYRNLYRGVVCERIEKIERWMDEIENM
jgi:hypothetical protein